MAKHRHYLDVIGWNCYVANSDARVLHTLARWAKMYRPDVFALSEARTHHHALSLVPGYTLFQERPTRWHGGIVDDTGDTAILVRDDLLPHVKRHRVATMLRRWMVQRYRRWHTPRRDEVVILKVRGRRWRVRASHPATGGLDGANRRAFREQMRKIRRWAVVASRPRTVSIDVGDLNERKRPLMRFLGRFFIIVGQGIDLLIAFHAKRVRHWRLSKGGSDHHGQRYRVYA